MAHFQSKNRFFNLAVTAFLLVVGLASRRFSKPATFVHDFLGDAIWAAMVFFGFRFLLSFFEKTKGQRAAFFASLAFCFGIEWSQIFQNEWLQKLRATWLGGLVLGFGFRWSDLAMYSIGIGAAFFFDRFLMKKGRKS